MRVHDVVAAKVKERTGVAAVRATGLGREKSRAEETPARPVLDYELSADSTLVATSSGTHAFQVSTLFFIHHSAASSADADSSCM